MATALPPKKLFNFSGGLVKMFVTFRTNSLTFHHDCAQTIIASLSKFHTQSAHLLPFRPTYAPWLQLYSPKKLFSFLGGLVKFFFTFRKNSQTFHHDCAQTII